MRLRVALLGCGVVGSEVVRLLTSRPTTSPPGSARRWRSPGSPYAGSAATAATCRSTRPCSPPTPPALVERDDVDIVVEVIGGIEPARGLLLAALRAGKSVVSANKALLAEDGADPARRRRRAPASTSTTRPPSPGPSRCCARCASRWPATGSPGSSASSTAPPTSSSPRMDATGAGFAEALERGHRAGLRRGRPDRRRRGLRRRGQGRHPGLAGLPHPGHRRRRLPRGHRRGHRRRHGQRQGDGLHGQAARRSAQRTGRGGREHGQPCGCTRR